MSKLDELFQQTKNELLLSTDYLAFSYNKIIKMPPLAEKPAPDDLEVWESFTSRFARTTDLFVAKFIRTRVSLKDPAFRGEVRDFLDQAEKIGLIANADFWMSIRVLRNRIAHEYANKDLRRLYDDVLKLTPTVLEELKKVLG